MTTYDIKKKQLLPKIRILDFVFGGQNTQKMIYDFIIKTNKNKQNMYQDLQKKRKTQISIKCKMK